MKSIKILVFSATLVSISFASFGAKLVTITATGTTLDDLETQLAAKASAAGASSYKIIEAGGNNQMHGTAVLYK